MLKPQAGVLERNITPRRPSVAAEGIRLILWSGVFLERGRSGHDALLWSLQPLYASWIPACNCSLDVDLNNVKGST